MSSVTGWWTWDDGGEEAVRDREEPWFGSVEHAASNTLLEQELRFGSALRDGAVEL